jgi:hypothetical protein
LWESVINVPPKEQVPKTTLGTNLSGRRTAIGRNSGELVIKTTPKGQLQEKMKLNSQVKGQRRVGVFRYLSLSFLCAVKVYMLFYR